MTDRIIQPFSINLKILREACGFTQKELAEELNISLARIKKYETHWQLPTAEDMRKLTNFFQYSEEEMKEDIITTKTRA
jgi:transcriptional regulator with XRE-family HTH domain